MKNIALIFRNSIFRGRMMIVIAIVAGVSIAMIFSMLMQAQQRENAVEKTDGHVTDHAAFISSAKIDVGVIDYDKSPLSEHFKHYLSDVIGMNIYRENDGKKDYDLQANLLIDRDISAIIEIPKGFYNSAVAGELNELIITTLDDYENAVFVELYLQSYMQSMQVLCDGADGDRNLFLEMLSADLIDETAIDTAKGRVMISELCSGENGTGDAYSAFISAEGFLLMMFTGITLFVSNAIISDRQQGTYDRILCSIVKPLEYTIGVGLFGILCCTAVNLIFTLYVYALSKDMTIPRGLAFAANELFILFSVGFAIMIALMISSRQTLFAVGIGYTTFGSMFGGAWFPIVKGLGVLDSIEKGFPQYWIMDIFRKIQEDPNYYFMPNLCILVLFVLLVYLICAVIFSTINSKDSLSS